MFQVEEFRGNAIVNDAIGDVLEYTDPLPEIWSKVERFKACMFG